MTPSQQSDAQDNNQLTTEAQTELQDTLQSTSTTESHLSEQSQADDQVTENTQESAPSSEKSAPQLPSPRPGVPSPASLNPKMTPRASQSKAAPLAPAAVPSYQSDLAEAKQFARVTGDGQVFLIDQAEEFAVGQVPDATPQEALAYFVRKYDDVMSQVILLEQRLSTDTAANELQKTLTHLQSTVEERGMVGDMVRLRERLDALSTALTERKAAEKQAHEQAITEQREKREAIVTEAEKIAGQDPERIQWKQSSTRMNQLFDQWKSTQKAGPRLPKPVEDELWKRFRGARNIFDKHRRTYFSQLDATNAEAKKVKERLIARAEELSTSTEWAATSTKYRDLMDEWKAAPRASRKEDDLLWARFRAAQDIFFNARKQANDEIDREFSENLKVKEQILADGKKLLPFKDIEAGRAAMNDLRGRWEEAGKVPRKDMSRMETGFRKLEQELKKAEEDHWSRTNPETKARTNSALVQLEETIAALEKQLAEAEASGNQRAAEKAQESIAARRQWLAALQSSAGDN